MTSNKSKKGMMSLYIALIIIGCVFIGWGNQIVPNEYINFVIVLACFGAGLYGVMKLLGSSGKKENDTENT